MKTLTLPSITPEDIGRKAQEARKRLGLRQSDVAFACGTGIRFIVDLEKGKPTCQLGKVLKVCRMLGLLIRCEVLEVSDGGGGYE